MQPAAAMGKMDLPHVEGEGMALLTACLNYGKRAHCKEILMIGFLIAVVP
jgi:hypothetical protein